MSSASAEAASRIYNTALRTRTAETEEKLLPTTVWDSFFLHALLRDATKREITLCVPHNATNAARMNTALEMRNMWMVGTGQDLWAHACTGCQKIIGNSMCNEAQFYSSHSKFPLERLSACVTDGVTVGHVCCGVADCQIPLANQSAWFCPAHSKLQFICAVAGCEHRSGIGWRTCDNPTHRAFEEQRRTKGKAMFVLRARQARNTGQAEPRPPTSDMDYLDEVPEEEDQDPPTAPTPSNDLVKIRGRLSRRWTHNEQLIVRCCGIILSRATFFGSEAITSVKVRFLALKLTKLNLLSSLGLHSCHFSGSVPGLAAVIHIFRQ